MNKEEIIEIAVSNGFYKNDEGTVTSPFIEDIDISELLINFAKDLSKKVRFEAADDAWMELVKHGIGWELRKAVTDRIHERDEA